MVKKLIATVVSIIFLATPVIAAEKGEVKGNATQPKVEKKADQPKKATEKKATNATEKKTENATQKKAGNATAKPKKKVEGC